MNLRDFFPKNLQFDSPTIRNKRVRGSCWYTSGNLNQHEKTKGNHDTSVSFKIGLSPSKKFVLFASMKAL